MNLLPRIRAVAFFLLCSAPFVGVPVLCNAAGETQKSASAKKTEAARPSGSEWSDPDKLQKKLASGISRNFKNWDKAEADAFLKTADARTDLAAWELIRALKANEADYKDFCESTLSKAPARRFLAEFAADADWIEGYLYTAPSDNAAFALKMLRAFVDKDEEILTNETLKKIAVGVAGEFARRGWTNDEFESNPELSRKNGPKRIWRRYKFYAESWRERRLNTLFDKLDYWDMRIVVSVTGRFNTKGFGHEKSLRWGQDNVSLTESAFGGPRAPFQVPYRMFSKVGDSVQTGDYYAAFDDWYNHAQLKMARELGAVCGGVSHFGATAACANGIPAVTMGEPAHCSFAVRVGGVWKPNNSLSWERGVHWRLWNDENHWQFLHLVQRIYGNEKKDTMESFRIAALAHIAASRKTPDPAAVIALYDYALEKQPRNFQVWRDYFAFLNSHKQDKAFWKKIHKRVVNAFLPGLPDVGAIVLGKYVYPNLLPLTESDDERIALYTDFWSKTDGFGGTGRWDCESVWAYEVATLGDGAGANSYKAFRKNYNAKQPKAPAGSGAQKRYTDKIGEIVNKHKDYAVHFGRWQRGEARK